MIPLLLDISRGMREGDARGLHTKTDANHDSQTDTFSPFASFSFFFLFLFLFVGCCCRIKWSRLRPIDRLAFKSHQAIASAPSICDAPCLPIVCRCVTLLVWALCRVFARRRPQSGRIDETNRGIKYKGEKKNKNKNKKTENTAIPFS